MSAQNTAFPYSVNIEPIMGDCYDDCQAIITLLDSNHNEILINSTAHHPVDSISYPLYNLQFRYRNQNTGTNTRYKSSGHITLSAGTYCFGVSGYLISKNNSEPIYVDTSICQVVIPTRYEHLTASALSSIAQDNDYYNREYCGIRADLPCTNQGRIQLLLQHGKFPYYVQIINSSGDTVRNETFKQRQNNGNDSLFADYKDYYTFDHLKADNYNLTISDSCGYTIHLSTAIPLVKYSTPYLFCHTSSLYHCTDSNIVWFAHYLPWNGEIHNYHYPYLKQFIQYRFINPENDTTRWYNQPIQELTNYFNTADTLSKFSNYCNLDGQKITYQIFDPCTDTIFTQQFRLLQNFSDIYYEQTTREIDVEMVNDSCYSQYLSGKMTQSYNIRGYTDYDYYYSGFDIPVQYYSCPLSLEIRDNRNNELIVSETQDQIDALSSNLSFDNDTLIPIHTTIHDAKGCLIHDRLDTLKFMVEDLAGREPFQWNSYGYFPTCCYDRSIYLEEYEVDFKKYRDSIALKIIESPLYNKYNGTAIYQNDSITLFMENPDITSASIDITAGETGWTAILQDECLPPGRYKFQCETVCGIFEHTFQTEGLYKEVLKLDQPPQYQTKQICDKLIVTPHSAKGGLYQQFIRPDISNDEPITEHYETSVYQHVCNGVAGGYNPNPNENGQFIFTLPGDYIIQSDIYGNCETYTHYDTLHYIPTYISFDLAYAIVCEKNAQTGSVITHAINGTAPYQYILYDQENAEGNILAANPTGDFYDIPLTEGQKISVLAIDTCHNSFFINLVATTASQSELVWEISNTQNDFYCEGDSVYITALPFKQNVTYLWSGPNGFSSSLRENHIYLDYGSNSGWYKVKILNTGCKKDLTDSIYIPVLKAPYVEILSDTTLCAGEEITLAFATSGNGIVEYDIFHTGAPSSAVTSYQTQAGDTLYQSFDIWSDNLFWTDNISDSKCSYHSITDTTHIKIFSAAAITDSTFIKTIDGEACFNYEASLQAGSTLSPPYIVSWYKSQNQELLLQRDTVFEIDSFSSYTIPHLISDTTLFVTIANAGHCASFFGAIYHWILMYNGVTILNKGEGARFFDSGGDLKNYDDNEQLSHTFSCPDCDYLTLRINYADIATGDTLFIYGCSENEDDAIIITITNSQEPHDIVIPCNHVTFRFSSNWINNHKGWNIDILSDMEMTEVHAFLIPPYYDTVYTEICQSPIAYNYEQFSNIDISSPEEIQVDSIFIASNGCDSLVTLHLTIHPTKENSFTQFACDTFVWNEIIYTETGEYIQTLQTEHGCDSTVTLDLTILNIEAEIIQIDDFCDDYQSQLSVNSNGTSFLWSTGEQSPNIIVNKPGTYKITASDQGCEADDNITIDKCPWQVFLPNAITANGDGLNDEFQLTTNIQHLLNKVEVYIYNRWGQLVYSSTDINFKWDGSYKGKIYHNNVYTYHIRCELKDGQTEYITGSVTVL